jgi:hypothetical protein
MSTSPIISGLMVFFSLTTVGVVIYPFIKILPSRLEKRSYRKIELHEQALTVLASAIAANQGDPEQRARLSANYDYHRAALLTLKPNADAPARA